MSPQTAKVCPAHDDRAPASRFDRRTQEILNAAGALFNRHGLRDATLAVIAADIGLNLKSLRYYFKRREDLVAAAFMRSIELHETLAQRALGFVTLEGRLRHFVRSYFDLLADVRTGRQPEFVFFSDLRSLASPHADVVQAAYTGMFTSIRLLLCAPDVSWHRARLNASTHMLLSQLLWSPAWFGDFFPEESGDVADRFCDILLGGLAKKHLDVARVRATVCVPPVESEGLSHESFLRTATALINELGYRGASVDRISAKLNVTKGAFYHYNETRDALVVACFKQSFERLRAAQDAAAVRGGDGLTRAVAAAVPLVRRQMLDDGTLLRTSALSAIGPELRGEMTSDMRRLTLRFGDMLIDGLLDGSVRPCAIRIAAEMVTTTINSAEELGRWVTGATAENAAELYVAPLVNGLKAP